jgi:hypothetical protein
MIYRDCLSRIWGFLQPVPPVHRAKPGDPHCSIYSGVQCPPDCPNHGRMFDGCHICDCVHGPQVAEAGKGGSR